MRCSAAGPPALALGFLLSAAARPAQAEWNLGAYLGGAHTQDTFLLLQQPALGTSLRFPQVDFAGQSFDFPLYYGFRGGYFLGRRVGLEAEFHPPESLRPG